MFKKFFGNTVSFFGTNKAKATISVEIGDKRYVKVPFEQTNKQITNFFVFPLNENFSKVFFLRKERFPYKNVHSILLDDYYYNKEIGLQSVEQKAIRSTFLWLTNSFLSSLSFLKKSEFSSSNSFLKEKVERPTLLEILNAQLEDRSYFNVYLSLFLKYRYKKRLFFLEKRENRFLKKEDRKLLIFPKVYRFRNKWINKTYVRSLRDKLNVNRDVRSFVDSFPLLSKQIGIFLDPVTKLEQNFSSLQEQKKLKNFKVLSRQNKLKGKGKKKEVQGKEGFHLEYEEEDRFDATTFK